MRLNEWMTETGTTDDALAALVGVDRSTISRIRRGARVPSFATMQAICEATGGRVQPNSFFGLPAACNGEAA